MTELESQIRQARIAVNTDEVNLGYTRITAPLDGTIVSVPVDEGQTVNANQTTPTIVQIADLDKMEIKIEISEGDITAVKPGMPITYTILFQPETEYKATLTSIDPGLTTLTDGSYKTTSSTAAPPPRRPLRHRTMPCTITAKRLSTTRKARCASA